MEKNISTNANPNLKWIDIHSHLDRLEGGPSHALQLAKNEGIERIISIGTEPADLPVVLGLTNQFPGEVFCTLGVHPHEGVQYTKEVADYLFENAKSPGVVAIGEIGLDYYYNQSPQKEQIEAFHEQLEIAAQLNLPVEIHTRDAEPDTIEILKKFRGRVRGVIHCFTGTDWLAREALDLGFNISISGIVTFKNADALRAVVRDTVPLDRLHVETDAPFLAPVPMRGKPNTSAYMLHTAKFIADLKGVELAELSEKTNRNGFSMFPKLRAYQ